jgi:hypothetical protein
METIQPLLNELNNMVLQGKIMEAFEKFYAPDVVMQENEQTPTIGKDANRKREEQFINNLVDFRKAEVLDVAYGENISMAKWAFDYTHKEWGKRTYTQVSVQHWRNGQIVKEQFFYGN